MNFIFKKPAFVVILFTGLLWTPRLLAPPPPAGSARADLNRAHLPTSFYEEQKIVPLNSPETIELNNVMRESLAKLYPDHDWVKDPVVFVLSDAENGNGPLYLEGDVKVVTVPIKDLKPATSLDEIVSVGASNWLRYLDVLAGGDGEIKKESLERLERNFRERMAGAGFNPDAYRRFYKRKHPRERGSREEARWSAFDKFLDQLRDKYGGRFAPEKPLPPKLKAGMGSLEVTSYVDQKKDAAQWEDLSSVARAKFLSQLISETSEWNGQRTKDVIAAVREIHLDLSKADEKDLHSELDRKISAIPVRIPPNLQEEARLIPVDSKTSKNFNQMARELLTKLHPDYDWAKHPVLFVLTTDNKTREFQYRKGGIKVIGVSLKSLQDSASLDELAVILERGFQEHLFYVRRGEKAKLGKGDYLVADTAPLTAMADAKMNPEAALTVVRREYPKTETTHDDLIAPQPFDKDRIRAVEIKLADVRTRYGRFSAPTPVPPTLRSELSGATSESYVDRLAREANFASMSTSQKLDFIDKLIGNIQDWNPARRTDLGRLIRDLKVNREEPIQKAAQDALADRILSLPSGRAPRDYLYSMLSSSVQNWDKTERLRGSMRDSNLRVHPLGQLAKLDKAIRKFVRSQDEESAKENALAVLEGIKALKLPVSELRNLIDWYNFELPDPEKVNRRKTYGLQEVAWNPFVEWAHQDKSGIIAEALLRLGVEDVRLYPLLSKEFVKAVVFETFEPLSKGPRYGSVTFGDVKMDEQGHVTGINTFPTPESDRRRKRKELLSGHLTKELNEAFNGALKGDPTARKELLRLMSAGVGKSAIEKIENWDLMETNFELFMTLNLHLLNLPEYYGIFYRNLNRMAESSDPQKRKAVRDYFLNSDYSKGPSITAVREPTEHPESLRTPMPFTTAFSIVWKNKAGPLPGKDEPQPLFSKREQIRIFSRESPFFNSSTPVLPNPDQLKKIRDFIGYQEPKTFTELLALMESLQYSKFTKDVGTLEAGLWLERNQASLPSDIDLTRLIELSNISFGGWPRVEKILQEYVSDHMAYPTNLSESALRWTLLQENGLFDPASSKHYDKLREILDRVKELKTPRERLKIYNILLTGKRIQDPELRSRIMDGFVDNVHALHGVDRGRPDYEKSVLREIENVDRTLNGVDRRELFSRLADRLETQLKLSLELRDRLSGAQDRFIGEEGAIGMTSIFGVLQKDETGRKAIIDLLTSGAEPSALKKFAESAKDVFEASSNDENTRLVRKGKFKSIAREAGRLGWQNFWESDFNTRAVILESLLFPDNNPSAEQVQKALNFVFDKLFPPGEKYSSEAREFLNAKFLVLPEYQRKIFLAAALVAAQKNEEAKAGKSAKPLPLGERLAIMLEMLGPAETKFGQRVGSHPQTPDELRGVQRLKSGADPMARWDMLELHEDEIPEGLKKRIRRIKGRMGSASYYVVYEVEMKDGSSKVLRVLRPNALARAEDGFQQMEDMLVHLSGRIPEDALNIIREMIHEAKDNAAIEADSRITAEQFETARKLYDGSKVKVGDEAFTLHVPKVDEYGERFLLMDKAPGQHFNDLAEKTSAQKKRKRTLAKAYLAWELYLIAAGGKFDRDRHGAQLRVRGNDIYIFDPGGMARHDPSPQDRKVLGDALFEAAVKLQQGQTIDKVIYETIRAQKAAGHDVKYLIATQEAVLALQDFQKYIPKEEMMPVLRAVFDAGIHPDVMGAVQGRAMQAVMAAMTGQGDPAISKAITDLVSAPPLPPNECITILPVFAQ